MISPPQKNPEKKIDVCIIGGGINGVGVARDATGRGLSTILLEQGDLGQATSSMSSKLLHGGLRYLEYYEFSLVRKALKERNILLQSAPHIIKPMRFILPHEPYLRSSLLIRLGLFLYDSLAIRHKKLKKSFGFKLKGTPHKNILQDSYRRAFSYADCLVDDSRLVILNAMDAITKGADIRPHHKCISAVREKTYWRITAKNNFSEETYSFTANILVNVAGPWARTFLEDSHLSNQSTPAIRLVKGSHIVVKKLYEGDHAYILQQPDQRIVFLLPYEEGYTLIGTTEELHTGDPETAHISENEISYLCEAVNRTLRKSISREDIVWNYSGVRPLLEDGEDNASAVTRDYKIILDQGDTDKGTAPLLSVFGGKITTYRQLAETATSEIFDALKLDDTKGAWTRSAFLPGGHLPKKDFDIFLNNQIKKYPWAPAPLLTRYARAYGTHMDKILQSSASLKELGKHYGDHVYEKELSYMITYEMAHSLEDILWRRSKLGLHISTKTKQAIEKDLSSLLKRNSP